ncbi:MAG: hypothetical protein II388_02815, partial [Clostridia bacterium]|nr:hypothetical protein [Clostridia bacterium]
MLLSSVSYGAGAAETEAVTENINTAETETTTDTEIETDDTPVVKTLEFPVDVSGVEAQTTSTTGYSGACENVKDGVILHAFCWSFDTIKNNMADIAAAGYTAVQTSPPNACNKDNNGNLVLMGFDNTGHEDGYLGCWWWHYQPIDWKIGNYQLGTRQDYIDMCTEAHKYGIKIIADVLPNHTTPEFGAVCDDLVTAVGGTKNY